MLACSHVISSQRHQFIKQHKGVFFPQPIFKVKTSIFLRLRLCHDGIWNNVRFSLSILSFDLLSLCLDFYAFQHVLSWMPLVASSFIIMHHLDNHKRDLRKFCCGRFLTGSNLISCKQAISDKRILRRTKKHLLTLVNMIFMFIEK